MNPIEEEMTLERRMLVRAAQNRRPISGTLELLPLCNMNCDMCYVRLSKKEMEAKGRLRTAQEWISFARQMQEAGVLFLLLTGGEPLLFPDFRALYLELKQMGMILSLNTNGTLIDGEWAAFFGQHKPRRINVTLYGASEATYETLCHYSGGFAKALEGIRLLKARGVDVKINGSVTAHNLAQMDAIYDLGRQLHAPVHMDAYMVPAVRERDKPFASQSRLAPKEAAWANVKALRAEMPPEAFGRYARDAVLASEKKGAVYPAQLACLAGKCSFAITWQGEMRPCVTFSHPSIPAFDVGFEAAWEKMTQQAKCLLVNETCTTCPLRPLCKTCAASAFCETGACDGLPQYHCSFTKELLGLLAAE